MLAFIFYIITPSWPKIRTSLIHFIYLIMISSRKARDRVDLDIGWYYYNYNAHALRWKIECLIVYIAWSFTTSLNHKVTISWGFFRISAPRCSGMAAGGVSLKIPHNSITLRFCEVVKDHANSTAYTVEKKCNFKCVIGWLC